MEAHDPTALFGAVVGLAVLLGQVLATLVKAVIPRRDEQRAHPRSVSDTAVRAEIEELRSEVARGLRAIREDLEHERRRRRVALEDTKP